MLDDNTPPVPVLDPLPTGIAEAFVLAAALLALDVTFVATRITFVAFLLAHLLLYVAVVRILTRQLRDGTDATLSTTALGIVLVPAGLVLSALLVYLDSLVGPVLLALVAGSAALRLADAAATPGGDPIAEIGPVRVVQPTTRTRGYVGLAVVALALAVVLAAFSPLHLGGLLRTAPGAPLFAELIPASDEYVFGVRTPVVVLGRRDFHVTVELLPALVGLAGYVEGRRATTRGSGTATSRTEAD